MYQKISIHYSLVSGILVFLKLTPNIHFLPLFNCKAQIVICHVFLDTLRISWYTKEFFNWKLPFMSKHKHGWEFFSKYMDKGLLCYYVYDYCKIIVNVYFKKKIPLLTRCVTNAFHLWLFSCMTNWWLHIKNWHLVYVFCHFSIVANYHLPCVFFIIH
jgi:hypothetical protein